MKRCILVLLFSALCGSAAGDTLDQPEAARLRSEVIAMLDSFQKGDARALMVRSHDSLHRLYGSRAAFESASLRAVKELQDSGARFVEWQVGTPVQSISAGDEEVCFVPTVSILEVKGRRVRTTSFMVAIRRAGNGQWKYLDGAAFREKPELLHDLLPQLPRVIQLPPNTVEVL